jgi:SAM-dependent methyltransferase
MSGPIIAVENEDQAQYWNGPSGTKWVDFQSQLDRALDPLGLIGVDIANPQPGEQVIDIGCGCGSTSLVLADRVGHHGHVLGVDISDPMLALARTRIQGRVQVEFNNADASVFEFPNGSADLMFSRFGVMFFRDPPKAFFNIRKGLKPGARMVFVCWRPLPLNGWMYVPLQSALSVIEPSPPPIPGEPGPFAFADDQLVRGILAQAGFEKITFTPIDQQMIIGQPGDSPETFKSAVDFALMFGPLGRRLAEMDRARVEAVRAAITQGLQAHRSSDGVKLPAAIWVVEAVSP